MSECFGVILIDKEEIVLRVYQADGKEWKLLHYFNNNLLTRKSEDEITAIDIAEAIVDILAGAYAQHVSEWRIGSRGVAGTMVRNVSQAIGLRVEQLIKTREQELLCKGMFTELW